MISLQDIILGLIASCHLSLVVLALPDISENIDGEELAAPIAGHSPFHRRVDVRAEAVASPRS